MEMIWNYEGVRVYLTGAGLAEDPCFKGFATKGNETFLWHAFPTPEGYKVDANSLIGRRYVWDGATLNLGLEVAKAIARI